MRGDEVAGRAWPRVLAVAALGLACHGAGPRLRQYTYPPDFRYISQDELVGTMWQIAQIAQRLHDITRNEEELDVHRDEIRELLARLAGRVDALKREGAPTNHPLLNAHLDTFRAEIGRARRGVDREPPSYLGAVAIPSACITCHSGGT